ncbi:ferritin family protein [candidate division KSB1 bacterium]|nr:ferritin family protein [candidate division KSB1 bacterium]
MEKNIPDIAAGIKMAIEMEKKGRKFYLEAAANTNNETGKAIFNRLADEEAMHLATFERMLDTEKLAGDWRVILKEYPTKPQVPIFDEKTKKSIKPATTDELQALRIAMKQEREAMQYYGALAQQSEDEAVKTIFSFVREQEVYHHDLLQAEYDAIAQTGFWFDTPEFRMDGKF